MTRSNEQLVPVEQVDRDAAAEYGRAVLIFTRGEARAVVEGRNDECMVVQAFARHRLAALRTPPAVEPDEGLAPVAWLHTLHMEQGQESRRLGFVDESLFGTPGKDHSEEYPVTITPLYATPSIRAQALDEAAPSSSAEFHQRRGMLADVIIAALHEYDEWMKDDDYNAQGCLEKVVRQLERGRDVAALKGGQGYERPAANAEDRSG